MGQVGVGVVKVVHTLCELQHALLAVCGLQGRELHASHQEFLYFQRIILRYFFSDDLGNFLCYICIVQLSIILSKGLFVLVLFHNILCFYCFNFGLFICLSLSRLVFFSKLF